MSFPESTPEVARWCALFIALVLVLPTAASVLSAFDAESSGVAYYQPNPRLPMAERVTRQESPAKFRDAVQLSELHAFLYGGVALIAFKFYRVLSD